MIESIKDASMAPGRPHWAMLVTHKCNFSLTAWQLNYYYKSWGIRKFVLFCGVPSLSAKQFSQKKLTKALGDNWDTGLDINIPGIGEAQLYTVQSRYGECSCVFYQGSWNVTEGQFHETRVALHQWADVFLPREITHTLVVDNDEFLHFRHNAALDEIGNAGFHFVDIVPSDSFPGANLKWCLQSWYYRRQATYWPYKKPWRSGLPLWQKALTFTRRQIDHGGCKTFYFGRDRLKSWSSWHHGTRTALNSCYGMNFCSQSASEIIEVLKDTAVGYHMANPSYSHFVAERAGLYSKLQNDPARANSSDMTLGPELQCENAMLQSWEMNYRIPLFPVFVDNYLKEYLDAEIESQARLSPLDVRERRELRG